MIPLSREDRGRVGRFEARSEARSVPAAKASGVIGLVVNDDIDFSGSVAVERSIDPVAVFLKVPDGHRPFDPGASAPVSDVRNAAADFDDRRLRNVGDELLELFTHSHTPVRKLAPTGSRSDSTCRRDEQRLNPLSFEGDTEGSAVENPAFPPKKSIQNRAICLSLSEDA